MINLYSAKSITKRVNSLSFGMTPDSGRLSTFICSAQFWPLVGIEPWSCDWEADHPTARPNWLHKVVLFTRCDDVTRKHQL